MSSHPHARLARHLFGQDTTPYIVAVEPAGRDAVRVYRRAPNETVRAERAPFHPWAVLETAPTWTDLASDLSTRELAGPHPLRFLVRCATWTTFTTLRERLRATGAPFLAPSSPVEQYLLITGRTLFMEMRFEDLLRLQFDIETTGLDAHAPEARLLMIALTTNRGHARVIGEPGEDEASILRAFAAAVREIDPDIIEGHNIFNFDLPFLLARAEKHDLALGLGRDTSTPRLSDSASSANPRGGRRLKVGGRSIPFTGCHIYGRHVVDTYQQIQRYDAAGNLERYGLKDAIQALGMTRPGRVFLDGAAIAARWETETETVRAYALDDVRDVEALSALTLPTEFYQSQIIPWALQDVATRGPGEKIDDLIVRAYLMENQSLPLPQAARPYPGGYAEVRATGVFAPVAKADVESLYPSLMLAQEIGPASDHLSLYLPLLRELTTRRLDAKRLTRETSGPERAYWQGMQSSLKVLINSFYGYLGYSRATFNDYAAAERVTIEGQRIIKSVFAELERQGARIIEVDTDGVYFVPPATAATPARAEAFVTEVSGVLPPGINLVFDGFYAGMVSLKLKNYVLMDASGALTLHGSSLRSRREEIFARRFLREAARLFVSASAAAARDLYLNTALSVQQRRLTPAEFARAESITDKTFTSDGTRRLARAAAGAAVGDRIEVYQRWDGSLARIEDYADDEDVDYLLRRLRDMAARFTDLFETTDDFDYHFPPVTSRTDIEALRAQAQVRQLALF